MFHLQFNENNQASSRALAILCAALVGAWGVLPAVPCHAQGVPPGCEDLSGEIKAQLSGLFDEQAENGALRFDDENEWLGRYPLLAAASLHVYQADGDAEFLERAFNAISSYVNFSLVTADRDGDFLLERTAWFESSVSSTGIEDVGYNVLFANDLQNLTSIAIALNKPIDALYWYQGARTVTQQIVRLTYNADAGYFFPTNERGLTGDTFALSALITLFPRYIGDNVSLAVLRNQLLSTNRALPETPLHAVNWDLAAEQLYEGIQPDHMLRAYLLLCALQTNGLTDEVNRFSATIERQFAAREDQVSQTVALRFARCAVANQRFQLSYPHNELRVLDALTMVVGGLEQETITKLRSNISNLQGFMAAADAVARKGDGQQAVRGIYWGISAMRKHQREKTLFLPRHRNHIPGFEPFAAFDLLLADVMDKLDHAEDRAANAATAASGLSARFQLLNEAVTPGKPLKLRLDLQTLTGTEEIKSLTAIDGQQRETVYAGADPVQVAPGEPATHYYVDLAPRAADEGVLTPLEVGLEMVLASGERMRFSTLLSYHIKKPLDVVLTMPRGNALTGSMVPLQIDVRKFISEPMVMNAVWYSPSGLTLQEGNSFEMRMGAQDNVGQITANILVPRPSRPGAFPFLIKFFANGEDKGVIRSSMFKHYQWIFLGPFQQVHDAINASYPPQVTINLRERYPGAIRPISWLALANSAYRDNGRVDMTSLLPQESVGFLYTVIQSPTDQTSTFRFQSGAPAVLFVNGAEIARYPEAGADVHRGHVFLSEGMNNILIKMLSSDDKQFFFQLGDEEDMTADEYNNNLWEIMDGYQDFYDRSQAHYAEGAEAARIITLTYKDVTANSVSVIGTFNGWSPVNAGMMREGEGPWEISLHLAPGRYAYRFLVNNSMQVTDPHSQFREPDGYGGVNSVLVVK